MKTVIIVVPIYKSFNDLTFEEVKSLTQLKNILHEYPICLITPEKLSIEEYFVFFKEQEVSSEKFNESFFQDRLTYNQFCLSVAFYKRFINYDYMLIYQTDAFVFKNELQYWLDQGYDYIGAPFPKYFRAPFDMSLWEVGNGGFSLRSIKKSITLVQRLKAYQNLVFILKKAGLKNFVVKILRRMGGINLLMFERIENNRYWEDSVFGIFSKTFVKNFKVAPVEIAMKFSFEAEPRNFYNLNNRQLPFGCHAWEKFDKDFWDAFIEKEVLAKNNL